MFSVTRRGFSFRLADPRFIITVKTDNAGTSNNDQFTIPTIGGSYNYDVDWGDGTTSTGVTGDITHTYPSTGIYQIKIKGSFPRIYFNNTRDRLKLLSVDNWGIIQWSSFSWAFFGCENMDILATDAPNLANTTAVQSMFYNCTNLVNANGSINTWNTMNVTNMATMFFGATAFNQPIGSWNTSNVTTIAGMFFGATAFNQPIGSWNTSNVTNLQFTFRGANSFNQNIDSWNTGNVTNMNGTFRSNSAFNQPLNSWDMSNVTNISEMLRFGVFNQYVGDWNLRLAGTTMAATFGASNMSTANYTNTIVGWANYVFNNSGTPSTNSLTTQSGRTFDRALSGGANFANAGAARDYLVSLGWTISGDTVIN